MINTENEYSKDEILSKILKILSSAESYAEAGYTEPSNSFLEKAKELMDKYGIATQDIEESKVSDGDNIIENKYKTLPPGWKRNLLFALIDFFGLEWVYSSAMILNPKTKKRRLGLTHNIVGFSEDIESCMYMFNNVSTQIESICNTILSTDGRKEAEWLKAAGIVIDNKDESKTEEMKKAELIKILRSISTKVKSASTRAWKTGFCVGAVIGFIGNLKKLKEMMKKDTSTTTMNEIATISKSSLIKERFKELYPDVKETKGKGSSKKMNPEAFDNGMSVGAEIETQKSASGESSKTKRLLSKNN